MKLIEKILLGLLLTGMPLWSQVNNTSAQSDLSALGPGSNDDQMRTPPPVSGQSYSSQVTSEERSNYLRGGLAFSTAYSDNALGSISSGKPISDISYSVGASLALDETRSRLHFVMNYAPGFTFYQRTSSRNEQDQNLSIDLKYRLTAHVTLFAQDGFLKTSNVLNQQSYSPAGAVFGGAQAPNFSVIPPFAD